MQVNMNKSINKLIIGQQIDFTPTADNLGLNHNVFPESLGVFESRSARRHLTAATNAALSKVPRASVGGFTFLLRRNWG